MVSVTWPVFPTAFMTRTSLQTINNIIKRWIYVDGLFWFLERKGEDDGDRVEEGLETIKHVDKRLYRLAFGRMFDCHKNKDGMMNYGLKYSKDTTELCIMKTTSWLDLEPSFPFQNLSTWWHQSSCIMTVHIIMSTTSKTVQYWPELIGTQLWWYEYRSPISSEHLHYEEIFTLKTKISSEKSWNCHLEKWNRILYCCVIIKNNTKSINVSYYCILSLFKFCFLNDDGITIEIVESCTQCYKLGQCVCHWSW